MPITYEDWISANAAKREPPERHVTPEVRADAQRAQTVLEHPGFHMFQAKLGEERARVERQTETVKHRLVHGRGVTTDEIHRLREDASNLDGRLWGLDMALGLLPEIVKAGTE